MKQSILGLVSSGVGRNIGLGRRRFCSPQRSANHWHRRAYGIFTDRFWLATRSISFKEVRSVPFILFRSRSLAVGIVSLCFALPAIGKQAPKTEQKASNPLNGQPAAIAVGQSQFIQNCAHCHGADAKGGQGEGQGPNLVASSQLRRASDATLFGIIHNGIPGSAMPSFSLADRQIWQLVSFVRSLAARAIDLPVSGNVAAGRAIFFGKGGCSSCHMIHGDGGFLGPDLTNIGAARRLDQLRDSILKTARAASDTGDLYGDPLAGYRPVVLKLDNGQTVEGIAKHYSNYSVEILDKDGKFHLLHGDTIKNVEFKEKSWMPDDYGKRLTPAGIRDLLAFLSRQSDRPRTESRAAPAVPHDED
jgi:cytochrome c oxidase cbb3-type subunit III